MQIAITSFMVAKRHVVDKLYSITLLNNNHFYEHVEKTIIKCL